LKNVIVDIANDVVEGSPVETGNNKRSIQYEAKGLEGSVYSTSGYGGFLEVGTRFMSAQPYFKPALDMHLKELPEGIKTELK
jgi:HK97 gp10 family phage protein